MTNKIVTLKRVNVAKRPCVSYMVYAIATHPVVMHDQSPNVVYYCWTIV